MDLVYEVNNCILEKTRFVLIDWKWDEKDAKIRKI